ncbi:MAG TPA: type II methionyl aminopeptidase [Planctomycetota bacterium]|jgi:methionyl aminopeptidase|nr:type II methionyl aminopeptidase [Planctomycetota bacterium]
MNAGDLEKFRQAGRIAAAARDHGAARVKPGALLRDVLEAVEEEIRRLGGEPAFPAQSSRNHIAAHYCASPEDETRYEEGDLVKLDVGVHVDGFVADTATTIDLGPGRNGRLREAAEAALAAAIAKAGPGVSTSEIGGTIAGAIRAHGYRPVSNLTGHGVGRWQIHCAPSIPNVPDRTRERLKAGMVIAIEPFSTDGAGTVEEKGRPEVFRLAGRPKRRDGVDEGVLREIEKWGGLPFARRSLRGCPREAVEATLTALARADVLVRYPPLCEEEGKRVAQSEHTVYVGPDGVEVLTR